jgi:DNA-binding MarR family transcriptional regulator
MKDDFTNAALPESSLTMLIAAARRQMKHAVEVLMEPYGLHPYHCWMILLLRHRGAMSLSELAGRMWMDHPTTSRLVHALEEANLLQIQPDPTHGRKVQIAIHPDKLALADEIHARVVEYRHRLEKNMSTEETAILHSALAKLIVNLTELLQESEQGKTAHGRRTRAKIQSDRA